MDAILGPHTADRFADDDNCELPVFNSRFFVWGYRESTRSVISGQIRTTGYGRARLTIRFCEFWQRSRRTGLPLRALIVPWYESSYCWPTVRQNGSSWHELASDVRRIPAVYRRSHHTSLASAVVDKRPCWTLAQYAHRRHYAILLFFSFVPFVLIE